jgi:hypothetical protein
VGASTTAAASIAVALLAACAPRAVDSPTASIPPASVPTAGPTSDAVAASERVRVGGLQFLHAKGVAEIRWKDDDGNHFEQGDADVRWSAARGCAASISKFGDRYALLGTDGRRWWSIFPKAKPSRMEWGAMGTGAQSQGANDALAANPRYMGLLPLLPAAGAVAQVEDGLAWFNLADDAANAVGIVARAGFDPATLTPRAVRLRWPDGSTARVEFGEMMPVETVGAAQGAWPRIPRRIAGSHEGRGVTLSIALDSARADAEAVDRPGLYDMDALRARFAPEQVEESK